MIICANCMCHLPDGVTTGDSSLYRPNEPDEIILCERCFHLEEAMIEEQGTNNLPHIVARYRNNLALYT